MKLSLFIILLFFTASCKESITQNGTVPTADAGLDQTINLGSYALLDGSRSSSNNGKLPYFKWKASPSNPADDVFRNYCEKTKVAVSQTGVYKYYLQVHNGESFSSPDSVTITVLPRTEGIVEDILIEQSIRMSLEKQSGGLTPENLSEIGSIYISDKVYSLKGIEHCVNLRDLTIRAGAVLDLNYLSTLHKLERLILISDSYFTGWDAFRNLTSVKSLGLYLRSSIDLTILENMKRLENLTISTYSAFSGLNALTQLREIKNINLSDNLLEDISFIPAMKNSMYLAFRNNRIKDISPFILLESLIWADFSSNLVEDISSLKSPYYTETLYLEDNKIKSIKPLYENNSLGSGKFIYLRGNPLDSISINFYIPELRKRGVHIGY